MMVHDGVEFNEDLLESYKLTKGNRRYEIEIDGPEMIRMREFLEATYESFRAETWTHYAIQRNSWKGKEGRSKMNTQVASAMILSSAKSGTQSQELETRELIDVRFVASVDWYSALKTKFNSLLKRPWKFREHLNDVQLERVKRELPEYAVEAPVEEKKSSKKTKKRKRTTEEVSDVMPQIVLS